VIVEVERPDHKQTIIIFCCAFAGLIFLGVISIIVFYQYRKKALDKRANQLKIEQYNYDMRMYNEEPPVVNYDDLKLEQCLHRGRFGEVRITFFFYLGTWPSFLTDILSL